ncbi:MAG: acyl-CoA dehydrogenase family protein [Acidimicrobiales bacterium]
MFNLSKSGAAYIDRLSVFLNEHVVPAEARVDRDGELVTGWVSESILPELRETARQMDLYLPQMPAEYGGQAVDLPTLMYAAELSAPWRLGPLALNCMAPDEGNMHLLLTFGTEIQKEMWLRPIAEGRMRSCFAMTEPDAGSDPSRLKSRADRQDDGTWVINAHKVFTSSAFGADLAVVMVVTDSEIGAHQGQSMFLVPTDTPGFKIVRDIATMGAHGFGGHTETTFTDVVVGPEAILGELGQGFAIAQSRLGVGRLGHAMRWIGVAQYALDLAAKRALSRETFGAPLSDRQAIQWWLADGLTKLFAARLMVLHTCQLIEAGLPHRTQVAMVKSYTSELYCEIVDHALQVFGGWGYTKDFPIEAYYRDARATRIFDGPNEVQRMLVARHLFKAVAIEGTTARLSNVFDLPTPVIGRL